MMNLDPAPRVLGFCVPLGCLRLSVEGIGFQEKMRCGFRASHLKCSPRRMRSGSSRGQELWPPASCGHEA